MRAAKLLSSSAAELAKSVELAACARGVEAYLAGGGSDNLAHDLALHVWPRRCPGTHTKLCERCTCDMPRMQQQSCCLLSCVCAQRGTEAHLVRFGSNNLAP